MKKNEMCKYYLSNGESIRIYLKQKDSTTLISNLISCKILEVKIEKHLTFIGVYVINKDFNTIVLYGNYVTILDSKENIIEEVSIDATI